MPRAYTLVKDSFEACPLPSGMQIYSQEMRSMLKLKTISPGSVVKCSGGLFQVCETIYGTYQLISLDGSKTKKKARYRAVEVPMRKLSQREREVLMLMARDMKTKEIAITLGISERTAMAYISEVREKLMVGSREGAVGKAFIQGILVVKDKKPMFADEV